MLIQVHNHFDFYSVKEGEEPKHIGYAENLVTDKFYNAINSNMQKKDNNSNGAYNMRWMAFGTGTAAPNASTGALGSLLGIKSSDFISCDYDKVNRRYVLVRQIALAPTEYVGSIITEVGIMGYPNSGYGNLLITHALIKDANGNNIGIEKTGEMSILIKATVYINDPVYTDSEDCPGCFYYDPKYRKVPYGTYGNVWNSFVDCLTTVMHANVAIQPFSTYNFFYTPRGYRFRGYPEYSKSYTGLAGLGAPLTINIDTANGSDLCHGTSLGFNGNYYAADRLETGAYQHYNFKNTQVSNAVLGTGDGVTTRFKMPHINATEITNSLGLTYTIDKGTKKKYRVITDPSIVNHNNYNNDWKFTSGFRKAGMYFIPYKDGYFVFDGIFSVKPSGGSAITSVALQGLYLHHISAFTDPFLEPCEIELPSDLYTLMYNAGTAQYFKFYPTNDGTAIIMQYTNSSYNSYGTYVIPYDKTTGTTSAPVMNISGRYLFKRDMTKAIKVASGKVYFYDIVATGSAWQLTNETIVNFPAAMSASNPSNVIGSAYNSEFLDDIIQLIYTDRYVDKAYMQRYTLDWTAKTLTSIDGSTTAKFNLNVTPNYKAVLASTNVLNIYDHAGTTLKATFDISAKMSGISYAVTDFLLFEHNNDLFVIMMQMDSSDSNRNKIELGVIWLKIDTDGTIYDMNLPANGINYDYNYGQGDVLYTVIQDFIYDGRTFKTLGASGCYFKDSISHSTGGSMSNSGLPSTLFCMLEEADKENYIVFDSAPASGSSVLVSYKLDYLPKTADWIATITPGINFSH